MKSKGANSLRTSWEKQNIQAKQVYCSILNGSHVIKTGNKHDKKKLTDFYFKRKKSEMLSVPSC